MSVQTKAGVHIPTTTECDQALGIKTSHESGLMCWEMEGSVVCPCGKYIPVSQWKEHSVSCASFARYLMKTVRRPKKEES